MGITWIGNLLFFTEELLFVAYIMTIFIAGQGIIIFILLVPLSKQVNIHFIINIKWMLNYYPTACTVVHAIMIV